MKLLTNILLVCMLIMGQLLHGQALTDSLVLHLPFNGNVADISGNGYIVTNSGATLAPDRFGNENLAYYFDGGDKMTISAAQNLPNIDSAGYTVALWVKPDMGQTSNWANIASYGRHGHGGYALICVEPWNGLFVERIYNNTAYDAINFDSDHTNLTTWSMLTISYKNGLMKGYLNGVLINEIESIGYTEPGYDFNIGASSTLSDYFKGWIDDIYIFNRALTDIEIAKLSGLSGAVRATKLKSYSLADFELGVLEPIKYSDYWAVWGASQDYLSYITVVENPLKSSTNTSEFVGTSVTFPTGINTSSTPRKKEYVITSDIGTAYDHHHIMQWKFLLYDSTLLQLDTIMWDWMCFNQIHQGYQLYDGGECQYGGSIAYGGGIFNDNTKAHGDANNAVYEFKYRAMPDSAKVPYTVEIGKWMTFTYEIFWTKSDSGFWRLWKDGELLSSANNVQTIADCAPADGDLLHFKVGQYNKWNDAVIDSLPVYFDDVELYIDPEKNGISVSDICPECSQTTIIEKDTHNVTQTDLVLYPNPVSNELHIGGEAPPSSITLYTLDGRQITSNQNTNTINLSHLKQGIYIAVINLNGTWVTKKIIKE